MDPTKNIICIQNNLAQIIRKLSQTWEEVIEQDDGVVENEVNFIIFSDFHANSVLNT